MATIADVQAAVATQMDVLDSALDQQSVALVDGVRNGVKDIRTALDGMDVTADAGGFGSMLASRKIDRLLWERDTRLALVSIYESTANVREALVSLSRGRRRQTHTVRRGETLHTLAAKYLGSWSEWTRIADLNDIVPGSVLEPGTVIEIPERG